MYCLKKTHFYSIFLENQKNSSLEFESIVLHKETEEEKKLLSQKIESEKRRRNQAYRTLDYELALSSYFDFFSADVFDIVKKAKFFAYFFQEEEVSSIVLLFSLFFSTSEFQQTLEEYGLSKEKMLHILFQLTNEEIIKKEIAKKIGTMNFFEVLKMTFEKKNIKFLNLYLGQSTKEIKKISEIIEKELYEQIQLWEDLQDFLGEDKRNKIQKEIGYSSEVVNIFEKAAENSILRFKTPIISIDILFLTIMESNSVSSRIVKKVIGELSDWYVLRYHLIKHIHMEESHLRNDVKKNQQFFAYLLKTELTSEEFQLLIEKESLQEATIAFRDSLIKKTLEKDLNKALKAEIYSSIRTHSVRNYSQ